MNKEHESKRIRRVCRALVFVALCSLCGFAAAQSSASSAATLKKLSLEELANIEVTSVSRIKSTIGQSAAAVSVVTNEDIRRSGATSLPAALRLVPGIFVAQQTSDSWAVSSRGFSSTNSEKLLVLSDTRSVYTPLYSGVFWDVQDVLLQDVDRIEVIRGPGASLWGSNAVNGVISITTKNAKDTQGIYAQAGGGSTERAIAGVRYGGKAGDRLYYRLFGKYFDRGPSVHSRTATSDESDFGHFGFRTDWEATDRDTLTLEGDLYRTSVGLLAPSVNVSGRPAPTGKLEVGAGGGNLLARLRHGFSDTSDVQFRIYYDRTHRNDPSFVDDLDTVDLDIQHTVDLWGRQQLTSGWNYRFTDSRNEGKGVFAVQPPRSRDNVVSGFFQDQITITERLRVVLGTKLEHNDFSGFELQPTARGAWDLSSRQMVWAAVSHAARVPTRLERDLSIDVGNPSGNPVARLLGNRDFDSEKLTAYEVGYRVQPVKPISVDVAAFRNRYSDLASLEFGTNFIDPASGKTIVPIINRNLTEGTAKGIETLLVVSPVGQWRLTASHSFLQLGLNAHGQDLNRGRFQAGSTPRHQFSLRSFLDLPQSFQVDAQFRHMTAITKLPSIANGTGLRGYSELDARLSWRGWKQLEISVVGQNLLHDHHAEFGAPDRRGEIKRGVYTKIAWGF